MEARPTPVIPERTSSLRSHSSSPSRAVQKLQLSQEPTEEEQLKKRKREIEGELDRYQKKLKPQGSFSVPFWQSVADVALLKKERCSINRKLSIATFSGSADDWENTSEGRNIKIAEKTFELDRRLSLKQAERLQNPNFSQHVQTKTSAFVKLFFTSKMGLGITFTGAGERKKSVQQTFKRELIASYDASKEHIPLTRYFWCPVLSKWVRNGIAAHLFAYCHGQDLMDAIFGPTLVDELWSPKNGMIVSEVFEDAWDLGILTIVPNVGDDATSEELNTWENSDPKEYKLRVLNRNSKIATEEMEPSSPGEPRNKSWNDLDGKPLEFRNTFRPRARYLYFHHICQLLKAAFSDVQIAKEDGKTGRRILNESGKKFWGTKGRYVSKNEIRGFIEHVGHEYDFLAENGADDDASTEVNSTLVQTVTNQILSRARDLEEKKEEDGEGEEDDDESE